MTASASPDQAPHPWSSLVRAVTWLQLGLGTCYLAAFLLYGWARLAIGSHDAVVDGNNDPKDLGSGLANVAARLLHALGIGAALTSPFAGILLGLVASLGYLASRRVRADSTIRPRLVVALCVSVALAAGGGADAVSDIRHWIAD
jgi:hypothetical protein